VGLRDVGCFVMWVTEQYLGETRWSLAVKKLLFEGRSAFQKIEIYDTACYGKVLVLDGVFQTSVHDEHSYHELITHPAMALAPSIDKVLIVGGGDGGTAREVLRYEGVEQADLVEIDELVINACKKHMPEIGAGAWTDPRLRLHFADAAKMVGQTDAGTYDLIVIDCSDPVGPAEGLFSPTFFADCKRALKPGGLCVMQSGAPSMMPAVFYRTVEALASVFGEARPVFGEVPLYASGQWSWTIAGARVCPDETHHERSAPFADTLRVYCPELHAAAFVAPVAGARRLKECSRLQQPG